MKIERKLIQQRLLIDSTRPNSYHFSRSHKTSFLSALFYGSAVGTNLDAKDLVQKRAIQYKISNGTAFYKEDQWIVPTAVDEWKQ